MIDIRQNLSDYSDEELIQLYDENGRSFLKVGKLFGKLKNYTRIFYTSKGFSGKVLKKILEEKDLKDYYKNPNICKHCGKVLDWEHRNYKYCSRSCAVSDSNKGKVKNPKGNSEGLLKLAKSPENKESRRLKGEASIIKILNEFYPEMYSLEKFIYIDYDTPFILISKKTNKEFKISSAKIHKFIKIGCPSLERSSEKESLGEYHIRTWLESREISFNQYTKISKDLLTGRTKNSYVDIDFELVYNEKTYWIEFNGQQHYINSRYFNHSNESDFFEKQLIRDSNIREYCNKSNIVLIEIPYTYDTQEKVNFILEQILLKGENPNNIIKIPEISY